VSRSDLAVQHLGAMARGDRAAAEACLHPENINHMAADEPPACALPGVPGFMATSAWLAHAFDDMSFEVIEVVDDGDRTMTHVWFRGRQTGPFVVFPPGSAPVAFPPTGRTFAVRQCHVFRLRDGLHAEHIAVRDDLGMMTQLGHLPPSPRAMARMARWTISGGARRAVADVVRVSAEAAAAADPAPAV
jgi:predicted ester cyclase